MRRSTSRPAKCRARSRALPDFRSLESRASARRDYILARMSKVLKEYGSSFAHAVRLDQYYPTPAPVDPYHHARKAVFGGNIPPSTSVVMEGLLQQRDVDFGVDDRGRRSSRLSRSSGILRRASLRRPGRAFAPAISLQRVRVCRRADPPTPEMATLTPSRMSPRMRDGAGPEIRKQTEYLIVEKLKVALAAARFVAGAVAQGAGLHYRA